MKTPLSFPSVPLSVTRAMVMGLAAIGTLVTLPMPTVASEFSYEPVAPWQLAQGPIFSSAPGRFAIAFPETPVMESESDDIDGEPIEIYEFEVSTTTSEYIVAYTDLPAAFLSLGAEAVLNEIRDYILEDIGIEDLVELEVDVQLAEHLGRRYRYSDVDGTLDMRLYLVDERMYFVAAAAADETAVDRFISSFELR